MPCGGSGLWGFAAGAGHGLGALGRGAAGESAAPWLVSAQLSEEMGVGGCRAVLEPSVCPCWENRALVSQMTRKQK